MGRGNVCVAGPHEGLYYIDNDHFHVYRRDEPGVEYPETRLMGDLSYDELTGNEWLYDEWGTGEEEDDILECFISSFVRMFPALRGRCSINGLRSPDLADGPAGSSWKASCSTSPSRTTSGRWLWSCSRKKTPTTITSAGSRAVTT